ncbi:MAG: type II toxin-antitoxin system YafQ family toxin [Rhodospirillales bacterium]|nr:type II toxin-antitoxin system YafQ family toxin [Rhodospirillales bacterium]MDE0710536.1 type II toxin-antitoxin system YafQ family toxin [Rhodospirillales bacterium]
MTKQDSARSVRWTRQFKRDYQRERKGRHRNTIQIELAAVIRNLATDRPLEARYRDHALSGPWGDCRDCHLRPDLVLIYRMHGPDMLELVRLGSHSELEL